MNEGTVRGSLAGVAARFANQADRAQAFMTGGMSYDDRVKNYMARHPGASLGRARTMAKGASLLNQTARGLGGGAMLLGATGKAALGVMQSQPLRDVVKRGAKVAATGIAAAALTSNPITLPQVQSHWASSPPTVTSGMEPRSESAHWEPEWRRAATKS